METVEDLFNNVITLMVENGFDTAWLNEGISRDEIEELIISLQLSLPDDIVRIFMNHNGMKNEAFYTHRFFCRYHMYRIQALINLYTYDLLQRDQNIDYPIRNSDLFPILSDDSNFYCVCISDEDFGGIYILRNSSEPMKVFQDIRHFLRTIYRSVDEGILIYTDPYILNENRFMEISNLEI